MPQAFFVLSFYLLTGLYVVYVFVKDEKQSRNVEPNDDVSDDVDEKIPLAIL